MEEKERRALANDREAQKKALPAIRERQRQNYLKTRELTQLALFRKQVAEEAEEERTTANLTAEELATFAQHRQILKLAEQQSQVDDGQDGYVLPEEVDMRAKEAALNKRHVERDQFGNERVITEFQQWEIDQAARAKAQAKVQPTTADKWEYVFDESQQINFVASKQTIISKEQAALTKKLDEAVARANTIEESRKSLPIYQFRQELLEALKEYQVLIVVAETGK